MTGGVRLRHVHECTGRWHTRPITNSGAEKPIRLGPDDDVDQQFRSILEGLRTTLPGSQVLLGFLLILPFQSRFEDLSAAQDVIYVLALGSSALASVLLIAPSVHQRVRAPLTGIRRQSRAHLLAAVRLTIAGSILLGVAIVSGVGLVTSVVFGPPAVIGVSVVLAVAVLYTWLYQPLVTFSRDG